MAKTSHRKSRHWTAVVMPSAKRTLDRPAAPERFSDALRRFRAKQDMRALGIGRSTFTGLRSNEAGRAVRRRKSVVNAKRREIP